MGNLRKTKKMAKTLDCRVFSDDVSNILNLTASQNKINHINRKLKRIILKASTKNDIEAHDSIPMLIKWHKKHTNDLMNYKDLISKQNMKNIYIQVTDDDIKITEVGPKDSHNKIDAEIDEDENSNSSSSETDLSSDSETT